MSTAHLNLKITIYLSRFLACDSAVGISMKSIVRRFARRARPSDWPMAVAKMCSALVPKYWR